jgi:transposase-like protein
MSKIARFVIWICSKFTRDEIEQIIAELLNILRDRNPEVKPKDNFKENHPNYRYFYVDPNPPLKEKPDSEPSSFKDFNQLLSEYLAQHGKPLSPVKHRSKALDVPESVRCPGCNAPYHYIYYNDGKKKSQLLCKVCHEVFQLNVQSHNINKAKYWCPYCHHALFRWKDRKDLTIYKCCNDHCPHRIQALNKLNLLEKVIQKTLLSQFKLCYQYREYHFPIQELQHSAPDKPKVDITKIYNSQDVLGLILSFHISFAISARKTAFILRSVFNIPVSYQTVLNYAEAAAYYCHRFNVNNKGFIDNFVAADETYIKIMGKHAYVFFCISSINHKIIAYHVAFNRDTQPATAAMLEAIRTALLYQKVTFITDGNPSYDAAMLFINSLLDEKAALQHVKVIGLQNLDTQSEQFRSLKQIIERLNRTYKHHIKSAHGFNSFNGAVAITTLFVTHYNFLRPHMALRYKTPIHIPALDTISTIQGKWAKILSMAA